MNTAPTRRIECVRASLREQKIEAFWVSSITNCHYVSGFSGSTGALFITQHEAYILTDFRYRTQVAQECPLFTLHQIISGKETVPQAIAKLAAERNIQRLAFESDRVSFSTYQKLGEALKEQEAYQTQAPELVPTENIVDTLREIKDNDEMAHLRQAIAITDEALASILPQLTPELTEREVAWRIEVALHTHGAEGISFPIIVAAGPHAAMPHAQPTTNQLGTGRPIIIDMGARYHNYHADLTRTVVLGEPDTHFWNVYETVKKVQEHAIANIRAGMTGAEADAIARDKMTAAGYGNDAFGHGLGHGVGLDIHEEPRLKPGIEKQLRAGTVFSIEPGIYLEGWGGVRIEDLVLLSQHGCTPLSQASKHPVLIHSI